jgi:Zn-dependent M28 family amino/carboxypeptidase
VIVGGHFDFAEHGSGIVDDWSGASLLPSLYEALKAEPRRHTFLFVAFAEEELGLIGSRRYVKAMVPEKRSATQETLRILHSRSDRLEAIRPDDYYQAYRLIAFYLAYLDEKLP